MRSIPAFSKKSSSGPCVGGSGHRSGFTQHVKTTNAGKAKSAPHMAGAVGGGHIGGSAKTGHPSFKSHSGSAGKSVAAFSKKKI